MANRGETKPDRPNKFDTQSPRPAAPEISKTASRLRSKQGAVVADQYSGKFRLYKLSDFEKLPAMRWFIKSVVPRNGITLLFGEAKIGKKTFLGISKACAIATGTDWCGFSTTKGRVLYIVGEEFFGVLRRVAAWEKLHGVETSDNLRLLRVPINFFNDAEVENALAAL
jgi:hypothetical protein